MEIIKALEQLSLHVKTNQNELLERANISNKDRQLDDFDHSIKTLFAQITDLHPGPRHSGADRLQSHPSTSSTAYLAPTTRVSSQYHHRATSQTELFLEPSAPRQPNGSLDTSQEEDSDNSSQQSGYVGGGGAPTTEQRTTPFVSCLMGRDLDSITNTVRRIGQILSLGKEIESIYTGNLGNSQVRSKHAFTNRIEMDPFYSQSLCNTFINLCIDEPIICDLPTIRRYNGYCHELMNQLNMVAKAPNSNENGELDDVMCLDQVDDELDCAILEYEQQNINANWTDNKLYDKSPTRTNKFPH